MPDEPQSPNAQSSLTAHAAAKGVEIYQRYGPHIGGDELRRILEDRDCVRYPCEITFDASALGPGEFAHPVPKGETPEDGFVMHVHPFFRNRLEDLPPLVLYQLVLVNYGEFAGGPDAEAFGAGAMGMPVDDYYERVCALADELAQSTE